MGRRSPGKPIKKKLHRHAVETPRRSDARDAKPLTRRPPLSYCHNTPVPLSPADFSVSPSSGVPIYRQLIDQVHAAVAGGRLAPGEPLPSVRALALALEVNPMTVSKAWSRLEAAGVLARERGRGMRLADTPEGRRAPAAERRARLRPLVEQAVVRARQLGLTDEQFLSVSASVLKEIPDVPNP